MSYFSGRSNSYRAPTHGAHNLETFARVRSTFDNRQVAHVWIQQNQNYGRSNNGNFYFDGGTIYSYGSHFPIATILETKIDSRRIVLVTEDSYSPSTGQHQGYVRNALQGRTDLAIFYVPTLGNLNVKKLDAKTLDAMRRIFIGQIANLELTVANYAKENSEPWTPQFEGATNFAAEYFAEYTAELAQARESYRLFQRAFKYRRKLPEDCAAFIVAEKAAEKKATFESKLSEARRTAKLVPRVFENIADLRNVPEFGTLDAYKIDENIRVLKSAIAKFNQSRFWLNRGKAGTVPKRAVKTALDTLAPMLASWEQYRVDNEREGLRAHLLRTAADIVSYIGDSMNDTYAASVAEYMPTLESRNWQLVNRDGTTYRGEIPHLLRDLAGVKNDVPEYETVVAWLTRQASIALAIDSIEIGRPAYRETARESNEEKARRWIAGENVPGFQQTSPTLVRKRGDTLETSRGASAPFAQAVGIYRAASLCKSRGTSWHRNGEHMRVGSFELDSIASDGSIRVGCHHIDLNEMERLAVREIPQQVTARFPLPVMVQS